MSSNIDFTTSNATPTYNTGFGLTGTTFTLKKWGNIVFACGFIDHQETSLGVFIGTVPEGFRPIYNSPVACVDYDGTMAITINVISDGRIYMPSTQAGTGTLPASTLQVNGSWLVN